MRILRIIPSMNPSSGGPCQGIRNIIPELKKLGISNEVVCLDDPSEIFITKDNFTITALGPSTGPWAYSKKLIPWIYNNLNRFDVVIVHALWLYHGYAFRKAFGKYKQSIKHSGSQSIFPRFYVMPHGMLDPYFQLASGRKMKALRNFFYWKLIESKLINEADGLLFTCEEELLLARKSFQPYKPKKELNIGYGIETPPAFEIAMKTAFFRKCPEVNGQPFILFLSRLHQKKGIDQLIEAYLNIVAKTQESENSLTKSTFPKLVIAGPGLNSAYGKKLQQLVLESPQLSSNVFFPGMLEGDEKWGAFYSSDVFILPSHQENFGIAVVEALACRKAVLISNKVNIWREIKNTGAGMVEEDSVDGTQKLLINWFKLSNTEKEKMNGLAEESYIKSFSIRPAAKRVHQMLFT